MAAPYVDLRKVINGAGEAFVLDNSTNKNTHASTPCTTTVITFAAGITVTDFFKAGDVIKVTSVGTAYCRIASVTATTITLETALSGAPSTGVAIYLVWRCLGATEGGIVLATQISIQEQNIDQTVDPSSIKGDKRTTTLRVPLVENDAKNMIIAWGLETSALDETTPGEQIISVGSSSSNLNTGTFLVIGEREDGTKVSILAQKAVNTGSAETKFAKNGQSIIQLELRLIHDSTKPTGKELAVIKMAADYEYGLHALAS